MTQRFGKWPKYLGNGLDTWGTAYVFENRLNYLGNIRHFPHIYAVGQILKPLPKQLSRFSNT